MPKRKGKKSAVTEIDLGLPPEEEPAMDDWDSDGANGAPQQSRSESVPQRQATDDVDDGNEPPEQPRRKRDLNDDSDDDATPRKKKKKKKKKKKNRNVDDEETIESVDTSPPQSAPPSEDVSTDFSEISEHASEGGRKKKKKKKKKKGQQNDPDDLDVELEPEPEMPPPSEDLLDADDSSTGNKKKKKKKKKKKGGRAADDDEDLPEPPPPEQNVEQTGGGKKKKKKKKNKNKKSMAQRAEEQGQRLFEFAKELQADLDEDLEEFFNDDEVELFMQVVTDAVVDYQDDPQLADDEEFFELKKMEIADFWEQLVSGMKEMRDLVQEGDAEENAAREREERIAALKAQGLSIGPRGQGRQRIDHKAEKRRAEREKLRQARLLLQKQQEEADDDDDDDDADDGDADSKESGDQEEEKEQDETADKSGDSDWDDSDDEPPAKPARPAKPAKQPARKAPVRQNYRRGGDDSGSDDGGSRQQKKRRNRRRGGGGPQQKPQQQRQQPKPKQPKKQTKAKKQSPTPADPAVEEQPEERKTTSERPPVVAAEEEKVVDAGKKGKKNKRKKVPLRSPICVVMGHVDAGKTKILDKIRSSDVQGGEVGGITQQIGATYLSIENVKGRTELLEEHFGKLKYKVPGLLFIDTPGHESFANLRSRGSSMCDIAVLVVNIMEGLQPQTIESLNLLRDKGAQFVVAVNQIDRLNQWVAIPDAPFKTTFASQNRAAQQHFETLMNRLTVQFAEHSWNTALYYENKRIQEDMSLVPVSAHTGEGLPDLLMVVVRLTQKFMSHQLELSLAAEDFRCTILEVKNTVGHGATIDVILSNGLLRSDDTIVVCGMRGPIMTPIRALLLPHEAQEMRVRGEYRVVDEVPASAGIRISAHDLATSVAGSSILLVPRDIPKRGPKRGQIMEALKDEVQSEFARIMSNVSSTSQGVYVQASTLGALEALVTYLGDMKVPISGINIGDVHKSDVMKAGIMLEFRPEYALILAFNIRVTPEAEQIARQMGVRIFAEEIIYHLFDRFKEYIEADRAEKKRRARDIAVFPCKLEIMQEHIINARKPLIMGCLVRRGCLRLRTPLVAQKPDGSGDFVYLGRVDSIQSEGKDQEMAQVGDKVAVKIVDHTAAVTIQYGRQFDHTFPVISLISRESIDALKTNFKDELLQNSDDVAHLKELKRFFNILG